MRWASLALCAAAASALVAGGGRRRGAARSTVRKAVHVDIADTGKTEWYILQCVTGSEVWCRNAVSELLLEEKNVDVRARIDEIAVPTELVATTRGKSIKTKEKVLYPGYVFVRTRLNQRVRDWLIAAPRFINFIGDEDLVRNGANDVIPGFKGAVIPIAMTPREVETMLAHRLSGEDLDEGSSNILRTFKLGDAVAVTRDGGLMGERGLVRSVKDGSLIVSLTGAGSKALDVELAYDDVRKLGEDELAQAHKKELARLRAQQAAADRALDEARRGDSYGDGDDSSDDKILKARQAKRQASRRADDASSQREADSNAQEEEKKKALRRPSRWDLKAMAEGAFDDDVDEDAALPGSAPLSAADADFFDSLLDDLVEGKDPLKKKKPSTTTTTTPRAEGRRPPAEAKRPMRDDDDSLLRALLGDDFDPDDSGASPTAASALDLDDDAMLEAILDQPLVRPAERPQEKAPPRHQELAEMTVPALKERLRARGLKLAGNKADLISRLSQAAEDD